MSERRTSRRQRKKRDAVAETRRKKEFTYRGLTLEELKELPREDAVALLPARARRSFARGLDDQARKFLERVASAHEDEILRTHCRDVPILPEMVGRTMAVYDGQEFQRVDVEPEMIGHYLGEFALTRKKVKHTGPGVGATRSSKFVPLK